MSSEALAQLSNQLVYATMVVLLLAMVASAYDFAVAGRKGRQGAADDEALVGAGAAGSSAVIGAAAGGASLGASVGGSADDPVAADAPSAARGVERWGADASGAGDGSKAGGLRTRADGIAESLSWLAFGLLTLAVLTRGLAAGRVPWGNMYEFALTATWSVLGLYLLLARKYDLRWMSILIVTPVLLYLGLAITVLYTEAGELVPALRSSWLIIHVSAAIISFGLFTVGVVLSSLYLAKSSFEAKGSPSGGLGFLARVPESKVLDQLAYRMHAFVFPLWTFSVIAGAIWAENAWGRYWGWDPKETWAFITWVIYAGYLHARATAGWSGRRVAIIALVGYASLMFNFIGVNIWLPGLHSYAGV
jgi:cytochrome c-type biogenesis protein CcsB